MQSAGILRQYFPAILDRLCLYAGGHTSRPHREVWEETYRAATAAGSRSQP